MKAREITTKKESVVVLVVLSIALVNLTIASIARTADHFVLIRGALVLLLSGIFALCLLFRGTRPATIIASVIIGLSALNVLDQLVRSPIAPLLRLDANYPRDFDTNFYGALELYKFGVSPYGIEEKYHLQNPSVSFPFPTYALYWVSSGFGLWGRITAGLIFTALNVMGALLLLWVSFKLSRIVLDGLATPDRAWLLLTLSFVALNSPMWKAVMLGQTPLVAACLLVVGLWFAGTRSFYHEMLAGSLLALGVMIKPNFSPLLLYFPIVWVRNLASSPEKGLASHHLRVFLFSGMFIVLFILLSVSVPHGIRVGTYIEFVSKITPVLEHEVSRGFNISILGLLDGLLATAVSPKMVTLILMVATVVYGLRHRLVSWYVWLVMPLLISPISWEMYTALLLPTQFAIAREAVDRQRVFSLIVLLISVGLLAMAWYLPGAVGLVIVFLMALGMDNRDHLIDERCSVRGAAPQGRHIVTRDMPAAESRIAQ